MRRALYRFTGDAWCLNSKDKVLPWAPTKGKIDNLLDALSVLVLIDDEVEQATWTDGRKTGPIVSVTNGLLDVVSRELLPHSPLYFGTVSVPFDYNPAAPKLTQWLGFLKQLWP